MLVSEITTRNLSWAELNDVSLDFDRDLDDSLVLNGLRLMVITNAPTRNRALMPIIDAHLSRLTKLINLEFPDSDADINALKMRARKSMATIEDLKKQVSL